jgi:hypothetical protein
MVSEGAVKIGKVLAVQLRDSSTLAGARLYGSGYIKDGKESMPPRCPSMKWARIASALLG